jgi:hypothetical protein
MFNDRDYVPLKKQVSAYRAWRSKIYKKQAKPKSKSKLSDAKPRSRSTVIVEIGCGLSVPRLRWEAEKIAHDHPGSVTVIRINSENSAGCVTHENMISIPMGAEKAILAIDKQMRDLAVNAKTEEAGAGGGQGLEVTTSPIDD